MRLRGKPWAEYELANNNRHIRNPGSLKGKWHEKFCNHNDIHIEIGCGKGLFIVTMAQNNPQLNFIAIERSRKIMAMALRFAAASSELPDNLIFINCDAEKINEYFDHNELKRIYINFCDPWRNRYKWFKRRLTHRNYLSVYENLLNNGEVFFKTDNKELFEFSLREFRDMDWELRNVTLDLHNSGYDKNVMTEYEKRFSECGMPICRLEAYKK